MQFQKGQSGNPAGRPRGSRNTATAIGKKLLGDGAGELMTAAIARALDGDVVALRAIRHPVSIGAAEFPA